MEGGRLINKAAENYGIVPDVLDFCLGASTFAVYAALCIYANKEGWAFPAVRTIAQKLSVGTDTVLRAIAKLEQLGLLKVDRPERQGRGKFNRYLIVDKRGAPQVRLGKKGWQESTCGASKRGAPQVLNSTNRTLEQEIKDFSEEELTRNKKALEAIRSDLKNKKIIL